MKRFLAVLMVMAFFCACHSRTAGPVRTIENGIEVVDNGTGIYAVPGQPSSLSLREEFRIDLEDEALAAAGLSDIVAIDADSKGRIYLFRSMRTEGPLVFRFGTGGQFQTSFGSLGQGPGEVEYPHYIPISDADEIRIFSQGANRLMVFDADGHFLKQTKIPNPTEKIRFLPGRYKPLSNGYYLAQYTTLSEAGEIVKITLALLDSGFNKKKDLRDYNLPSQARLGGDLLEFYPVVGVATAEFFVNWGDSGRDIAVFDLEGGLKRIVRAAFPAVPVTDESKRIALDQIPLSRGYEEIRDLVQKMEAFPPYQSYLGDENGRLFVFGFSKDPAFEPNLCDIFSPDGVRFLRTRLGFRDLLRYLWSMVALDVVLKNGRAYCVREKPSGFKEVVVYKMLWK